MKKQSFKKVLGFTGIALASALMASNPQGQTFNNNSKVSHENKAVADHSRKRVKVVHEIGGLPLESYMPQYGLSPKEYGIRFGHGNRKGKTNFQRLAHNAKLKRR